MATPPVFTSGAILTAAQMNAVGMWKITSGTASLTTTPTQFTSVFNNTDYPNYKLFVTTTAASTSNKLLFRFLVGTSPSTSLYYGGGIGGAQGSNTTVYFERSSNAASLSITKTASSKRVSAFDIVNPNAAIETAYSGYYTDVDNADAYSWGGIHLAATAYDGFDIGTSAGTQTISYQLYGYRA